MVKRLGITYLALRDGSAKCTVRLTSPPLSCASSIFAALRVACSIVVVFAAYTVEPCPADSRPNFLFIVSEDNGPEIGCYGDSYVKTPVLDRLASEGVLFENAFVPQAGCSQSRAALLTGLYPHQNGQIGLATWKFRLYHEDTPNVVERLKSSGYRTGIIGKLHINPSEAFPFDFKQIPKSNFSRAQLKDYAKYAEQFFSQVDEPFFLSVNYPDAHRPFLRQVDGLPHNPIRGEDIEPLSYFGLDTPELRTDTADYYNCMQRLDHLIGELLAALERSGKAEQTVVIYLGDHGADLLRGKRTCYEGGLRVPLIVRWPQVARAGTRREELVSTLDICPTVLEAASAEPIEGLPGRPLTELLSGAEVSAEGGWRKYLFTEYHLHSAHNFYPQRAVRTSRFKLIHNLLPGEINPGADFTLKRFYSGLPETIQAAPDLVRTAYERMHLPPEYELYDLDADPFEFNNLAGRGQYSMIARELKERLLEWRLETHDPLLESDNLIRLKKEVEACFVDGVPDKGMLTLSYPDYFFEPN